MKPKPTTTWIPPEYRLPDTVAEIEAGRAPQKVQGVLFDDSVMARLREIKANERTHDN